MSKHERVWADDRSSPKTRVQARSQTINMSTTTSITVAGIIQRAAQELDGLGLSDAILEEAIAECMKELDKVAAKSLRVVLVRRLEVLAPVKGAKRATRAKPNSAADHG